MKSIILDLETMFMILDYVEDRITELDQQVMALYDLDLDSWSFEDFLVNDNLKGAVDEMRSLKNYLIEKIQENA